MTKKKPRFKHTAYLVDNKFRSEAMMLFSFCKDIDWSENGLCIASWSYKRGGYCTTSSLSSSFRRFNNFMRTASGAGFQRSMSIGDIICVEDEPWIVTGSGFKRVPSLLWRHIDKS